MNKKRCQKIIAHACTEVGIVSAAMTSQHKRAKTQIEEIQARTIVKLGKVYGVEYSDHDAVVKAHSMLARAVGVSFSRALRTILPNEVKSVLNGSTAAVLTGIMGNLVMMELSYTQERCYNHRRNHQHHNHYRHQN